jgi:hypothetical protein
MRAIAIIGAAFLLSGCETVHQLRFGAPTATPVRRRTVVARGLDC